MVSRDDEFSWSMIHCFLALWASPTNKRTAFGFVARSCENKHVFLVFVAVCFAKKRGRASVMVVTSCHIKFINGPFVDIPRVLLLGRFCKVTQDIEWLRTHCLFAGCVMLKMVCKSVCDRVETQQQKGITSYASWTTHCKKQRCVSGND